MLRELAHRVRPRSPRLCASCPGPWFVRARPRVSEGRLGRLPRASRPRCVRSTSALRNRFPLEHSCSRRFPARRLGPAMPFDLARPSPSSRSLSAPCPSTVASLPPSLLFARGRPREAPGSSGPPMRNEAGGNRASRRVSHFGARPDEARDGVFFRRAWQWRSPLAPLSPPPGSRFAGSLVRWASAVARRPPRPVPRAPRERRAHSRSRESSIGSRYAHPVRAEARTRPRSLLRSRRRSRDEDRRASKNRSPFATRGLLRLRAWAPRMVRFPFTRLRGWPRLSTQAASIVALLWTRERPSDFCNTTTHGHHHERRRFLVLQREATTPLAAFTSSRPFRDGAGWRAVQVHASEETCLQDRADPSKGSHRLSTGEAPPRTGSAHLFRRASTATGGGSLLRALLAPGCLPRGLRETSLR